MKKFLTLLAFVGLFTAASAQSTSKDAPKKEDATKVEKKHNCADHAKAHGEASTTDTKEGTKAAGCCAGKASAGKGCDHGHAKAEAGEGHGHAEMADMKEHACTEACKEGAHAYACGEKGHNCSADCHAKK